MFMITRCRPFSSSGSSTSARCPGPATFSIIVASSSSTLNANAVSIPAFCARVSRQRCARDGAHHRGVVQQKVEPARAQDRLHRLHDRVDALHRRHVEREDVQLPLRLRPQRVQLRRRVRVAARRDHDVVRLRHELPRELEADPARAPARAPSAGESAERVRTHPVTSQLKGMVGVWRRKERCEGARASSLIYSAGCSSGRRQRRFAIMGDRSSGARVS